DQEKRLQEYKEVLERLVAEQRLRRQDLEAQRGTGMQPAGAAATTADATNGTAAAQSEDAKKKGAGSAVVAQAQSESTSSQAPAKPTGQAPESTNHPPEIAQITQYPGVLTPQGKFVIEPALQYSYASNNRVELAGFTIVPALLIGQVNIQNLI